MKAWIPREAADRIAAEKVQDFASELSGIDYRLDMFVCRRDDPEHNLRDGFFYVRRFNEDDTVTFWEISDENGGWREPASDVLDALRQNDLRDSRVSREMEARRVNAQNLKDQRRSDGAEARSDEMLDHLNYLTKTHMSVPRGADGTR